jgi:hypothetical protein
MSIACAAGYGINSRATSCDACTPGYYSAGGINAACAAAAVGTYVSGYGADVLSGTCADSAEVGAASCYSSKSVRLILAGSDDIMANYVRIYSDHQPARLQRFGNKFCFGELRAVRFHCMRWDYVFCVRL